MSASGPSGPLVVSSAVVLNVGLSIRFVCTMLCRSVDMPNFWHGNLLY